MAGASPILEVVGISLRFGGVAALREVSFAIQPGEVFSIIGPNGAGKTSMVNCISGRSAERVSWPPSAIMPSAKTRTSPRSSTIMIPMNSKPALPKQNADVCEEFRDRD